MDTKRIAGSRHIAMGWVRAVGAYLIALLACCTPPSVMAKASNEYVAKFTFTNNTATAKDALSFEILGILPANVSASFVKGSRMQGPILLDDLTTRTRVRASGAVRTVNMGQTATIEVRLKNAKSARLSDPRWGVLVMGAVPVPIPGGLGRPAIAGGTWVLDPEFILFNDTVDVHFGVRNLQLFTNISTADFEMLDPESVLTALPDVSLPDVFLSPGTNSADQGLRFEIFPEPDDGKWLVASGQIYDSSGETVGAFIHGVQAIPEPSISALWAVGLTGVSLLTVRRRNDFWNGKRTDRG